MRLPLKELRERKGITQSALSKIMQVSPSTVGMWEQGRREPDYDNLKKLANLFDVTIDYLLGNEESKHDSTIPILDDDEEFRLLARKNFSNISSDELAARRKKLMQLIEVAFG